MKNTVSNFTYFIVFVSANDKPNVKHHFHPLIFFNSVLDVISFWIWKMFSVYYAYSSFSFYSRQ